MRSRRGLLCIQLSFYLFRRENVIISEPAIDEPARSEGAATSAMVRAEEHKLLERSSTMMRETALLAEAQTDVCAERFLPGTASNPRSMRRVEPQIHHTDRKRMGLVEQCIPNRQ